MTDSLQYGGADIAMSYYHVVYVCVCRYMGACLGVAQ